MRVPPARPAVRSVATWFAATAVFAVLCAPAPAAANPPDPLLPLIARMESSFRRGEIDGVTLDPRYEYNPPEVMRLSVVSQLLGYYELHLATGRKEFREDVAHRADYLLSCLRRIESGTATDGMLAYALLAAYEVTGDPRYFDPAERMVRRMKRLQGAEGTLNWGMMGVLALGAYHRLTGDPEALVRARAIVRTLPPLQNDDGSFPHYCRGSRDIHYTAWLAMELILAQRDFDEPAIDPMLARVREFLASRIGADGRVDYGVCATCSDLDSDGVCDEQDHCPNTPPTCRTGPNGCSLDEDHDGECDKGPRHPPCRLYYSQGSGCVLDYDTRGWVNELGYLAMVFDQARDPKYDAVMGFLYELSDHGVIPDKWDYLPLSEDPVSVWAAKEGSVIRTSVVFWALAAIRNAREGVRPAHRAVQAGGVTRAAADEPASVDASPRWSRGWPAIDRLVLLGEVAPDAGPTSNALNGPRSIAPEAAIGHRTVSSSLQLSVVPAAGFTRDRWRASVRASGGGDLEVTVLDVAGRTIQRGRATLDRSGVGEVGWDLQDRSGRRVPAGVYQVRVRTAQASAVATCVVVP